MALHASRCCARLAFRARYSGTIAAAAAQAKWARTRTTPNFEKDIGPRRDASRTRLMARSRGRRRSACDNGVRRAQPALRSDLAEAGYTGIKRVSPRARLWRVPVDLRARGHAPERARSLGHALGQVWETGRIGIKPYAAMGGLHAAMNAVLARSAARKLSSRRDRAGRVST